MSTEHEARAKALLPCINLLRQGNGWECGEANLCYACARLPSVAAALAEAKDKGRRDFVSEADGKYAAEHAEAEHYRNEAANVYLANEELQEQVGKLQAEVVALRTRLHLANNQVVNLTAELAAARVEGLREAIEIIQAEHSQNYVGAISMRIAALERGKTEG